MKIANPISIQQFRNLYTNVGLYDYDHILDSLEKLKLNSIKQKYGDFTFYCEKLAIIATEEQLKFPIFDIFINFFQENEKSIFKKLNKLLFIYDEYPYSNKTFTDIAVCNINAKFSEKEIYFTKVRDLTITCFPSIKLSSSQILNKTFETKLDEYLEQILDFSKKLKEGKNINFQIAMTLWNKIGLPIYNIYNNIENYSDKVTEYFKNRQLL